MHELYLHYQINIPVIIRMQYLPSKYRIVYWPHIHKIRGDIFKIAIVYEELS